MYNKGFIDTVELSLINWSLFTGSVIALSSCTKAALS
nr:MAG TPA: hypothetical protein [Bacteriophage sp.]